MHYPSLPKQPSTRIASTDIFRMQFSNVQNRKSRCSINTQISVLVKNIEIMTISRLYMIIEGKVITFLNSKRHSNNAIEIRFAPTTEESRTIYNRGKIVRKKRSPREMGGEGGRRKPGSVFPCPRRCRRKTILPHASANRLRASAFFPGPISFFFFFSPASSPPWARSSSSSRIRC